MNYQFITVQIDEATKDNSDAFKHGFKTIYDLTKERLIRVCKGSSKLGFKIYQLMTDFRAKMNLNLRCLILASLMMLY